jgi:hypothetical protein
VIKRDAAQAQPDQVEQVDGLARVLRGNASAAVEDAPWHERDISHCPWSGSSRLDSTILLTTCSGAALVEGWSTPHACAKT